MAALDLSHIEKSTLLQIARNSILQHFSLDQSELIFEINNNLEKHCGLFVSIYNNNQLRACLGRMFSSIPLHELTKTMSVSVATSDTRFEPIEQEEVEQLNIELSVLSPLQKIKSINEIELGKHGIYIENGYNSGVFLPQVATKTGWSLEEFLGHCSRDKANLGWNGWKNAEISIYTCTVFSESALKNH